MQVLLSILHDFSPFYRLRILFLNLFMKGYTEHSETNSWLSYTFLKNFTPFPLIVLKTSTSPSIFIESSWLMFSEDCDIFMLFH